MATTETTWLEDPALLGKLAEETEQRHASRTTEAKTYLRHYYDRPVVDVDYTRPYRETAVFQALKNASGGNLTREVVDAAVAMVCREMSAEVTPKGATHELREGCKELGRLIEGVFDNCEFLDVSTRCMTDAMTADVGPCVGTIVDGEITFERVNPLEYFWVEDGTGTPRTQMTVRPVSRDFLMSKYPGQRQAIKDLPAFTPRSVTGVDPPGAYGRDEKNTVKVVEAWCTALSDSEAGRHTVVAGGAGPVVLHSETWTHPTSPLFRFIWKPDFRGYGGVSLARIISRYDNANRRLLRMVYASLAGAVPMIIEQADSEISGFSDIEFTRVKYEGPVPPDIKVPQVVSKEVLDQIDKNYSRAYAEGGVNEHMASGSAPARYTSAVAQREFVDIANTRLIDAQKRWQQGWKDAAKVVALLSQQARKTHVKVRGAKYYESATWPKLPQDKYKVSFGLASGLSLTPAGRLQELQDLKDAEVIDTSDVIRNQNLPDTRAIADRVSAPRDLVMRQVSLALDKGIFSMPSAMQGPEGLSSLVKIGGESYAQALNEGTYPRANMETLRRLIKAAEARLAPPPAPPAPVMPAAPLAPQAMPAVVTPANDSGLPPEALPLPVTA